MKVYDKDMYNRQESLRTTFVIIFVFLIGFVAGYLANSFNTSNDVIENTNTTKITELK